MMHIFQYKKFDAPIFFGLIALWLAAFKSASLFNFLGTYSSLWYLPAGITLSIAMAVPLRFAPAPLIANWLLAVPFVSSLLGVEYTSVSDHLFHGARLFIIYGGAGLLLRFVFKVKLPIFNLPDQLKVISVTLIAAVLGAISGVSLHVAMGSFDWDIARDVVLPWFIGDGIAAIIVPPILVPLLLRFFQKSRQEKQTFKFPEFKFVIFQCMTVFIAMYVAFSLSTELPSLNSLWYVLVLPPIIFAASGGIPSATTSIAITALLTPPVATYFGFEGERISLQFLLLIGGCVSLMIGGAITDRDNAVLVIQKHEKELEEEVKARTLELEQSYRFQQHLIRSIGHDLQQPIFALNNMLAAADYLNKDEELKDVITEANTLGQTALRFISSTLEYAKREAGQSRIIQSDFPLQNVLNQIEPLYKIDAEQRGVILDIQNTNIQLTSDEHLVWEMVSNLVQNALRVSERGQIVKVSCQLEDEQILIQVTDEHEGHSGVSGSAGFGLEIVRQISQLLDVTFKLENNSATLLFRK